MSALDVHLINNDDNEKYEFPTRTLELRTSSSNRIITPTRAATDYEFNQKAQIPTEVPLDNQVYTSVADLNNSEFEKFMNVNGYYANVISSMELKSRLSQYSSLRLFLLTPTVTDPRDPETRQITDDAPMKKLVRNPKLLDRFIRANIQMQKEVGVNPITIPYIELPFDQYKELIQSVYLTLNKCNKQPVFFIDIQMRQQNFKQIVDLLTKDFHSNLIGIYHRRYRDANINYDYLTDEYARKDVAFIAAQVERSSLYDISTMHYLPFMGNDVYAIKRRRGFSKYVKDGNGHFVRDSMGKKIIEPPVYTTEKIEFFDRETLCIKNINTNPQLVERFFTEYRNNYFIASLLKNYQHIEGNKENVEALRAFSKVSELKASQAEFVDFQKWVNQNSTSDYLDEKKVLKNALEEKIKL